MARITVLIAVLFFLVIPFSCLAQDAQADQESAEQLPPELQRIYDCATPDVRKYVDAVCMKEKIRFLNIQGFIRGFYGWRFLAEHGQLIIKEAYITKEKERLLEEYLAEFPEAKPGVSENALVSTEPELRKGAETALLQLTLELNAWRLQLAMETFFLFEGHYPEPGEETELAEYTDLELHPFTKDVMSVYIDEYPAEDWSLGIPVMERWNYRIIARGDSGKIEYQLRPWHKRN